MSGSLESVRWNARVHRLDLSWDSHPKAFWGNGVRTRVNSKWKMPSTGRIFLRGGSNPRPCIKQDSEPSTLPTSYSGHLVSLTKSPGNPIHDQRPCLATVLLITFRPDTVCAGMFSGSSHTSDLKIGTSVATLPGAWCYRLSAGTGWPGVSILRLGGKDSLICNFYLSIQAREWLVRCHNTLAGWDSLICNFYLGMAARAIVWADPSLRYTSMLLVRRATNKQQQSTLSIRQPSSFLVTHWLKCLPTASQLVLLSTHATQKYAWCNRESVSFHLTQK